MLLFRFTFDLLSLQYVKNRFIYNGDIYNGEIYNVQFLIASCYSLEMRCGGCGSRTLLCQPLPPKAGQSVHLLYGITVDSVDKNKCANLSAGSDHHFSSERRCSLIYLACAELRQRTLSAYFRKEVFQPHLPVRLPCYDLAPITSFALGRSLR